MRPIIKKQKIFLYLFLVFSLGYLVTIPFQPFPGHYVIKAIPALSLAIMMLINIRGVSGTLLFIALIFSAAGDVTLSLNSGQYFILGLGLFLIAQITYSVTFYRDFKMQKSRIRIVAILVIYAVIMAVIMTPSLEKMALPVYVYLTVITIMGILAAFREPSNMLVLFGAVCFIISDSILAVNKFLNTLPAADYLVMVTYYLAQFLIVYGYLNHMKLQKTTDGTAQY